MAAPINKPVVIRPPVAKPAPVKSFGRVIPPPPPAIAKAQAPKPVPMPTPVVSPLLYTSAVKAVLAAPAPLPPPTKEGITAAIMAPSAVITAAAVAASNNTKASIADGTPIVPPKPVDAPPPPPVDTYVPPAYMKEATWPAAPPPSLPAVNPVTLQPYDPNQPANVFNNAVGSYVPAAPKAKSPYDVPYTSGDKPYVPPPAEPDAPKQYDMSMFSQPAISNADVQPALTTPAAPALVATKPSIIDRILAFLGLSRSKVVQAKMAGEAAALASMSRTDAAYSLVRRARNGDQNAMAMIAAVRDQALKGNKQAEVSVRLMHSYIEQHPTDENADMGAESDGSDPTIMAAVELSHGPLLTNRRIAEMTSRLSLYEKMAFASGMAGSGLKDGQTPRVYAAYTLGKAVGVARAIQASRMPHIPVGSINSDIGWEIGE